ncbi:family 1 encapsulin nanocompartment shell protein [Cellulosimicrobium cellulans]|uniref:Type 1 encapsulin shell protein n=1 Tax=Cellulosimicrobium cellulans TaxID=1710 RepID=A0A4Y4DYV5_CELCE|nr:family 1 encapsulin nanocompartment shell protein [Cellulosimicrobium cellulans]GED08745.1 bacteriocin [Cellulosimicrobium cellulans]
MSTSEPDLGSVVPTSGAGAPGDSNLHRWLAPVTDAAWQEIADEARRTFVRNIAGRRVVDVTGPLGFGTASARTGHVTDVEAPHDGIRARLRDVVPLVELQVPFTVSRQAVDDVARGSKDSDWQPVKDAATALARAEDRAVFEGYAAAGIRGIGPGSDNPPIAVPTDPRDLPDAVAAAQTELRLAGVEGPYALVLDADLYTAVSETRDHGYPIREQLERMVQRDIVWAPALRGGYLLTTRGGDHELTIGQDVSIGYLDHTADEVRLYLFASLTFQTYTAEASVHLTR